MTAGGLITRARQLGLPGSSPDALAHLVADARGDRELLEAARDELARHLHTHGDDFEGTAALQLLNRALAALPRHDPMDWRVRWDQRFRRP